MLADVGGDDGLAAGEAVDLVHQVLRLDFVFGVRPVIGMLVLPVADLRVHHAARAAAFFGLNSGSSSCRFLIELLQHALHVADDRDIGHAVLADFGRIDIHMDDSGVAGEGWQAGR